MGADLTLSPEAAIQGPGAASGAVYAGDTDKDDGAKAGRGHLQLGMNSGVTFGAESNCCGCGGNGIGARNARGNRGDWAGGARRLAGSVREHRRAGGRHP